MPKYLAELLGRDTSYVFHDTAANIAASDFSGQFGGGALAIASDTGSIYYDADGDFTDSVIVIGTLADTTGTLHADNIVF